MLRPRWPADHGERDGGRGGDGAEPRDTHRAGGEPWQHNRPALAPSLTTTASGNTYSVTITLNGAGTCTVNATAASGTGPGNLPFGQATAQVPIAVSTITTPGVPALVVNQATWIGDFGVGYSRWFLLPRESGRRLFGCQLPWRRNRRQLLRSRYPNLDPSSSNGTGHIHEDLDSDAQRQQGGGRLGGCGEQYLYGANLYYGQLWKVPFVQWRLRHNGAILGAELRGHRRKHAGHHFL